VNLQITTTLTLNLLVLSSVNETLHKMAATQKIELQQEESEGFETFLFDDPSDLFELSEADQAALFQLAQDIAAVESEIELLKETTEGFQPTDLDHPSFSTPLGMEVIQTPAFSLGSSGLFSSSLEEGRSALSSQQKRPRRKACSLKLQISPLKPLISKEQLLHTITHDLPPKYLDGVLRIVNPSFDLATAHDEDLEFDINLLSDDVLEELQHYVYSSISAPRTTFSQKRKEVTKRKTKKEAPKSRLKNQRKRMTRNSVASQKQKKTRQQKKKQSYVSPRNKGKNFGDVFKSEEIVRVIKSVEDEGEEVDILD